MKTMKKFLITTFSTITLMLLALPAFAQGGEQQSGANIPGFIALAAAICMGLGTFGGALSQGRTASAALEGIARNPQAAPKVQTPMIIALAMTESLVLFALVIAFFLQGYVPRAGGF
jgi:F-type H+-transporting ATPase subunit c